MTETFEPGELFVYRKAPGVYELGVVKRQRDDRTYYCYYSTGDTAAATPVSMMRKLTNAKWAPIQWANLWGGNRLTLDDLLCVMPEKCIVFVIHTDMGSLKTQCYEGYACHVPDCFGDLRVIDVRPSHRGLDIEVCDG